MNKLISLLALLFCLPVNAYIAQQNEHKPIIAAKIQQELRSQNLLQSLGPSESERKLRQTFSKNKNMDTLELDETMLAIFREAKIDKSEWDNIDKAKTIVRYTMLKEVEKRWSDLQATMINDSGIEKFKDFKPAFIQTLKTNTYFAGKQDSLTAKTKKEYLFKIADWGNVAVATDLSSVRWRIEFNSGSDSNQLQESAKKIKSKPTEEEE
jgi:hypothetical protein